jgi:hypothetical protein
MLRPRSGRSPGGPTTTTRATPLRARNGLHQGVHSCSGQLAGCPVKRGYTTSCPKGDQVFHLRALQACIKNGRVTLYRVVFRFRRVSRGPSSSPVFLRVAQASQSNSTKPKSRKKNGNHKCCLSGRELMSRGLGRLERLILQKAAEQPVCLLCKNLASDAATSRKAMADIRSPRSKPCSPSSAIRSRCSPASLLCPRLELGTDPFANQRWRCDFTSAGGASVCFGIT